MSGEVDEAEVARIAKGLAKAQREAILGAVQIHDGRWKCFHVGRVAAKLYAAGFAYPAAPIFAWRSTRRDTILTPLGLAVRDHLGRHP